jgi:hypothetical protein
MVLRRYSASDYSLHNNLVGSAIERVGGSNILYKHRSVLKMLYGYSIIRRS